jgi:hypothetical protein
MAARRVVIAILFGAIRWAFAPTSAFADVPAQDAPLYDPSSGEAMNETLPGQDAPADGTADVYADNDPSALTDFRAALDPHGSWVQDPFYGTVWVPNADEIGADFTPYVSAGHWAYDSDYVWMSDYAWGWVAFHYGRWERSRDAGWLWIPGRAYSGAWVSWRLGSDGFAYIGWAPMPASWIWHDGIAVSAAVAPSQPFVYCAQGDVFAPAIATHVVSGEPAAAITPHTRAYVPADPVVAPSPTPAGAWAKPVPARRIARPTTHGPPPAALGIEPSRVVRRAVTDRGMASALAYARPSTAQVLGAQPPVVRRPTPFVLPHYPPPGVARAPRRR